MARRPRGRRRRTPPTRASGLAHLVAVSGAHLVHRAPRCAAAALACAARSPARREPWACRRRFSLGFLVLAAAPPSAVRAAAHGVRRHVRRSTARRRPAGAQRRWAVCIDRLSSPPRSRARRWRSSFALSALSTLGIVLFAGLFHGVDRAAWLPARCRASTREALCAYRRFEPCAPQPLSAASLFSQVPVVAPLANVAAAPLFPVVCAGGLVGGAGVLGRSCRRSPALIRIRARWAQAPSLPSCARSRVAPLREPACRACPSSPGRLLASAGMRGGAVAGALARVRAVVARSRLVAGGLGVRS